MPESALIEAVNQLSANVERTEEELTALREDIANLPDNYIPREEAVEKAEKVKELFWLIVTGLVVAGLIVLGLVLFVRDAVRDNCRENRMGLRTVIQTAVSDGNQPLKGELLRLKATRPEECH